VNYENIYSTCAPDEVNNRTDNIILFAVSLVQIGTNATTINSGRCSVMQKPTSGEITIQDYTPGK
jgi:hypothetical protein